LFIHNLSGLPREVSFSLGAKPCELINLLSNDHSRPNDGGNHRILLEPYGYRWFRICDLGRPLEQNPV
jgi:maltose alpha-D-glucosyltransferase/alpha-amylase